MRANSNDARNRPQKKATQYNNYLFRLKGDDETSVTALPLQ